MTNTSGTMGDPQAGSDTAPLRAKSGWIIALGVVYLIAGLIALGSVMMATVASVLIVGVMMIIAGVAEVFSAFQIKNWGKFLPGSCLVCSHCRGLRHVRESAARGRAAHSHPRRIAGGLGHHADLPGLQHETGNTLDLGCAVRRSRCCSAS